MELIRKESLSDYCWSLVASHCPFHSVAMCIPAKTVRCPVSTTISLINAKRDQAKLAHGITMLLSSTASPLMVS